MNPDEMSEELALALGEFELYRGLALEDKWRYLLGKVSELERLRRENESLRYQVVAWRSLAAEFSAYDGKHEFYDRAEEEKLV